MGIQNGCKSHEKRTRHRATAIPAGRRRAPWTLAKSSRKQPEGGVLLRRSRLHDLHVFRRAHTGACSYRSNLPGSSLWAHDLRPRFRRKLSCVGRNSPLHCSLHSASAWHSTVRNDGGSGRCVGDFVAARRRVLYCTEGVGGRRTQRPQECDEIGSPISTKKWRSYRCERSIRGCSGLCDNGNGSGSDMCLGCTIVLSGANITKFWSCNIG